MSNVVRERLARDEVCLGTFIGLGVPALVEMIGHAGYHFVVIDLEHTALDESDVEACSRAAEAVGMTPIVRVPTNDWRRTARIVELGVGGIMAPHIRTASDARALVDAVKYPPVGDRGIDVTTRASHYGFVDIREHVARANENVLAIVLIEDREGIDNVEEIFDVPGVDVAITGPADLSRSYGVPGEYRHELVERAIGRFMAAAAERGIATMRAAFAPEDVATHVANGISLVTSPLNDAHFFGSQLRTFHASAAAYADEGMARRAEGRDTRSEA